MMFRDSTKKRQVAYLAALLVGCTAPIAGCGSSDTTTPVDDTGPVDTGVLDTGTPDTTPVDTGMEDTTPVDTGTPDTTPVDTGTPDTAPLEFTATPTLTPPPGTYTGATAVTIASSTAGAIVYFTIDGTDPNTSSPQFSAPVTLTADKTIKAMAIAPGKAQSATVTGVYVIKAVPTDTAQAPTITPAAGTYTNDQTLSVTSATSGATICYTVDGTTTPTCDMGVCTGSSATYNGGTGISISTTGKKVQALACKTGLINSTVVSASYTLNVADPTSNKPTATYDNSVDVRVSEVTNGAQVRFTTDGSTPDCTTVGGVFDLTTTKTFTENTTLKLVGCRTGYATSAVVTYTYSVKRTAPTLTPAATPAAISGTYPDAQAITIASGDGSIAGTTLCYRTDGTDAACAPSGAACATGSTAYATAVAITKDATTVSAITCDAKHVASNVTNAKYNLKVAPLVFSPAKNTAGATTTTVTTATPGACIYLGTTPAAATCPATIPATCPTNSATFVTGSTVYAIGCRTDFQSTADNANYPVAGTLPQPVFSVGGGSFINDQSLAITPDASGPADAYICYTSNPTSPGTTPVCDTATSGCSAGTKYTAAIALNATGTVVNAIECKAGSAPTTTAKTATYNFFVDSVSGPPTATVAITPTPITGGNISYGADVTFTTNTTGVVFHYTKGAGTTPSDPTCSTGSTVNATGTSASITITDTTLVRIKVIGCKAGYAATAVKSADYVPVMGQPTFVIDSVSSNIANNDQTVAVKTVSSGATAAKICYTLDGTQPTCIGNICGAASGGVSNEGAAAGFTVGLGATSGRNIRAIACSLDLGSSTEKSSTFNWYASNVKVTAPTIVWSNTAAYASGDVVWASGNGNKIYKALKAVTAGTALTDATAWQVQNSFTVTLAQDATTPPAGPTKTTKLCYRTDNSTGDGAFFETINSTTPDCTAKVGTTCTDLAAGTETVSIPMTASGTLTAVSCRANFNRSYMASQTFTFANYSGNITGASVNDFAAVETFTTSSTDKGYFTWDTNSLWFGVAGADVEATGATGPNYFHFYMNGVGPLATDTLTTTTGEAQFGAGTLPVAAHWSVRVRADGNDFAIKYYKATGWADWCGTAISVSCTSTGTAPVSAGQPYYGGTAATSFIKLKLDRVKMLGSATANLVNVSGAAVWNGTANVSAFPQPAGKYIGANMNASTNPNASILP